MKKKISLILITLSLMLAAKDSDDLKFIQMLYKNGNYEESITESEVFIKKHPDSKYYNNVVKILGHNYYKLENYEAAKEAFLKISATKLKNEANYYLVLINTKLDKNYDAEDSFNAIDEKSKLKTRANYILAGYFNNKENYNKAEEYYKRLLRYEDEYYKDSLLKLGIIYYKTNNYVKCSALLEEYLYQKDISKNNRSLVYYVLADSKEKINDYEMAEKYYKVIEGFGTSDSYYGKAVYNLTKMYESLGKNDLAKEYAQKMLETEFKNEGLIFLGEYYFETEDFSNAENMYTASLEEEENKKVRFKLLSSYIKQSKFKESLEVLPGLKDSEYDSEYYYYTMFIYFSNNEHEKVLGMTEEFEEENISNVYIDDMLKMIAESAFKLNDNNNSVKYNNKLYKKLGDLKYLHKLIVISNEMDSLKDLEKYFEIYSANHKKDVKFRKDIYTIVGNKYVEKNKLSKAEKVFKEFLENNFDDTIVNNLVSVLLKLEKYSDMAKYLNRREDTPENLYYKGVAYMGMHDYAKSSKVYEQLIYEDSEYKERAYVKLINSLFFMENYDRAIAFILKYEQNNLKLEKIEILDKKAISYFRVGNYNEALKVYEELEKYDSKKDYAYFMQGEIYYNQKDFEKAKIAYENVVLKFKKSKYRKDSIYWLINVTYQTKEYDMALSYIDYYLKTYEKSEYTEDVLFYLGNIYIERNEITLAVKEYEKVYNITKDTRTKENLSTTILNIYFKVGQYENAKIWLENLEDSAFKSLWAGMLEERLGNKENAAKAFEGITGDSEYGDDALYNLGKIALSSKEYEKAISYFDKVVEMEISEYKDDAIFNKATAFEEQANFKRALTTYMRIKLLYENSPIQDVVSVKVAEMYEKMADMPKAIKEYEEFYGKYKESQYYIIVIERLIELLYNDGKQEEAKKYYVKLKELDGNRAKDFEEFFK